MNAEGWIQEYMDTDGHPSPMELLNSDEQNRVFNIVTLLKGVVDISISSRFATRVQASGTPETSFINLRHMWVYHNGAVPAGHWVFKRCEEYPCSTPGHLYTEKHEGYQFRENLATGKARSAKDIMDIHKLVMEDGISQRAVASIYELSAPVITNMLKKAL